MFHCSQNPLLSHYPAMKQFKGFLFKLTLKFFVLNLRLLGLFPYCYNISKRTIRSSTLWYVYTVTFLLIYAIAIGFSNVATVKYVLVAHPQYNVFMLTISMINSYIGTMATYLTVVLYVTRFRNLLTQCIALWYTLRTKCTEDFDRKIFSRFLVKMVFIDGTSTIGAATIRAIQAFQRKQLSLLAEALSYVFSYSLNACTTNLFVAAAYLGGHYFRLINGRIYLLHQQLNDLEQHGHVWRLNHMKIHQLYDEIMDEMDQLVKLHDQVNQTILNFMQLHDITLIMLIIKNFGVIMQGIFIAYVSTVVELRLNQTPSLGTYGMVSFLAAFHFCQFYYLTSSALLYSKRVKLY